MMPSTRLTLFYGGEKSPENFTKLSLCGYGMPPSAGATDSGCGSAGAEDGSPARYDDLTLFAERHRIAMTTVDQVAEAGADRSRTPASLLL